MKKVLASLIFILAFVNYAVGAPTLNRQYAFTTANQSTGLNVIGLGIGYYRITYATTGGTTSACTVSLQGSTDNSTWSSTVITGTTCTSDGVVAITASGTANSYVRVNLSAFTANGGSPTITVNLLAYVDVATGTTGGSSVAGRVAFFDTPNTITGDADLTFATDTLTATKIGVGGALTTGVLDVFGIAALAVNIRGTGGSVYTEFYDTTNALNRGEIGSNAIFTGGAVGDFGISSRGILKLASNFGTVAITIDTSQNTTFVGNIALAADNTKDLFASGARGRSGYFGTNFFTDGGLYIANAATVQAGYTLYVGAGTSGFAGKVYMTGITNANAQDFMCYNTTTKEVEQNVTTCNLSSELYKHDIKELDIGLNEILKMQPVSFIYNLHPEIGPLIGFTAQRTEPIDKRLVSYFKDGSLRGVDYMGYTAVLTKAIQELNDKVVKLEVKLGVN